jgi:hypothetical protein
VIDNDVKCFPVIAFGSVSLYRRLDDGSISVAFRSVKNPYPTDLKDTKIPYASPV